MYFKILQNSFGHNRIYFFIQFLFCHFFLVVNNIVYNELNVNELAREHKTDMCDFLEGEQFVIETEEELLFRVKKLKDYLMNTIKKNQGYKILLISHYDIIWYMTSTIMYGERFGIGLGNGEINSYTIDDVSN